MKPVKLLRCTLSNVSVKSTATVNGTTNVAYQWNATLAVVAQAHSDSTTPTPFFYNGNDVRVGDFITTSGDGKSLKVASITTKTANSVVCVLEDDQFANALSDETGNLDGMIQNGAGITGFIFEVNNNVPVIASIPTAMPGNIPVTFAQNIKSRFENIYGASNLFSSSLLKFGDGTTGDQMLTVQTNASYAHKLGVKGGKWQLTNDGSTYTEIALRASTLAGYGIADAFTKTETTAAINATSKQFSFTMAFVGSNPSTTAPSDLPAGWTYAVSGSDVTITHTVGKPLATIGYWGISSTGGVQRYRLPSASNEVTIPTTSANSQFVFRISTAVAGADTDGTARIVMLF